MDGLECSEVYFSKILSSTNYFRLESEYFNSNSFSFNNIKKGSDLIEKVQYGTSKLCDENSDGIPVLRLNELQNGFIVTPAKYCHTLSNEEYNSLRLNKGDVLIIRTNGNPNLVGKSAIVMEDTNYAFASYLYRVYFKKEVNPFTMVAFLNSKFGRLEIDKNSMKGNQTNFSPAKLADINIPIFSFILQEKIKYIYEKSYLLLTQANAEYYEAEKLLEQEIGIDISKITDENISVKSFTQSFGKTDRLDAEYYKPKFDKLIEAIESIKHKKLIEIVNIKKSIEPGSEAYKNEGIPFIRISDISKFEITEPDKYLETNGKYDNSNYYLQKDEILFSKDGSIGIAYKVKEDAKIITSSALLHLTVKSSDEVLPDYLSVVLNSEIVKLQAERDSGGSIIKHWNISEIEEVLIPILDLNKQKEVASKAQKSFELREKSKILLTYAKEAVEIAIEKNENEAINCLKDKMSE